MKRKAAQVALSRLTDRSSFPRFSKSNDEKSKDHINKSTAQERTKLRETRSMTRQKTKSNLSKAGGIEKDLSGGKHGTSSHIRRSPRTTVASACSSVTDPVSSEEMDAESKEEDDEEENDVKSCKIHKRDGNSVSSDCELENAASENLGGLTRSSLNQQRSLLPLIRKRSLHGLRDNKNNKNLMVALRKSGTYNNMVRKSKFATANQQTILQISRELRSRTVDSVKEKQSIGRNGSCGLLLRKSNSTRDNRNTEFLRKRLRKIRMRSQREKVTAVNKTTESSNGIALQKTLAHCYKLKDVHVNIETLKVNGDDGSRPENKRKPKKNLGVSSGTSRSRVSSGAEQRSDSRSEESGSEETHVISDDSDEYSYESDDDDVICLSSSGRLNLEDSDTMNVRKLAANNGRGPVASSGHRQEPSASGENSGQPSLHCSAESNCSSSVGGMSAMDFFSIFTSLQNSYLQMKTNYEQQLHEKDQVIQNLQESCLQCTRLKNELEWKTQQVEDLSKAAEQNVVLEAKLSFLLSDSKAYEDEVKKLDQSNKGDSAKTGKKKKKQKNDYGDNGNDEDDISDSETADKKDNEADEIERLLIGLKESSDDQLFPVGSVPLSWCQQEPTIVPDSSPTPTFRKFGGTAEHDALQRRGRHNIRKLVSKLQEETKTAAILESERRERVKNERLKHLVSMGTDASGRPVCSRMVLAFKDEENRIPWVDVDSELLGHLKLHQVEAVEFMWDCIVESVDKLKNKQDCNRVENRNGCVLAHCMGLGKTLSVITFMQTILKCELGLKHCLIVSPLNAVLNWVKEWEKWVRPNVRLPIYNLACRADHNIRVKILSKWFKDGGILIISYSLFRILVNYRGRSRRLKAVYSETLLDPGPDLVVCDEGHVLKNDSSAISKCLNRVSTRRRIVLTGTPLQNNLNEYHCMVNFVWPNLLGTRQEFSNRFLNPITNGQHSDSTLRDVQLMKKRAHVLHQMLSGCIQRRDYSDLMKFLPPKHEYVISVRLSSLQVDLYEKYLEIVRGGSWVTKKYTGAMFFSDYQNLMRIWTHPWILRMEQMRQEKKPLSFSDDDDDEESEILTCSEESGDEDNAIVLCDKEESEILTCSEDSGDDDNAVFLCDKEDMNEMDKQNETCLGTEEDDFFLGDKENSRKTIESFIAALLESEEMDESRETNDERAGEGNTDEMELEQRVDPPPSFTDDEIIGKNNRLVEKLVEGVDNSILTSERCNAETGAEGELLLRRDLEEGSIVIDSDCFSNDREQESVAFEFNSIHKAAKVFAEEVIQNWQKKTRSSGPVLEDEGDKICPVLETWWSSFLDDRHHLDLELSGKLFLLFEILRLAEDVDDKVLVFSQSLLSFDLIEEFLKQKNEAAIQYNATLFGVDGKRSQKSLWTKDEDYVRMDGSTKALTRSHLITDFNDESNRRLRLFLISTKAGGLGVNLNSANRVIVFDASWNPSHDIQSIFRVYRFGQRKPVYIYRFVAQGTMEEKIYERQVTKETLSHRVLDEQQIDRHFTATDLSELYAFKPDWSVQADLANQPSLPVPKDSVLAELLSKHRRWIVSYHDHDSLLERRPEEDLSEEERKSAWEEYENEKQGSIDPFSDFHTVLGGSSDQSPSHSAFASAASKSSVPFYKPSAPVLKSSCPVSDLVLNSVRASQSLASKSEFASKEKTEPNIARFCSGIVDLVANHIPPAAKLRFDFQMSHLPRIVEEIIKYNPGITVENLQKRLNAFVGIHAT